MEKTYKRSRQREKIYALLKMTESHPTAERIYEEVRRILPKISLGTIYRNLTVLVHQGRVRELDFGEGVKRYDAAVHEHYHFYCEYCGTVEDLHVQPQADINDRVRGTIKGEVLGHRLDYFGICSKCLGKRQSA